MPPRLFHAKQQAYRARANLESQRGSVTPYRRVRVQSQVDFNSTKPRHTLSTAPSAITSRIDNRWRQTTAPRQPKNSGQPTNCRPFPLKVSAL